jgi:hypothetical protein
MSIILRPTQVATADGKAVALRPAHDGAILISMPAEAPTVELEFREPSRRRIAAVVSYPGMEPDHCSAVISSPNETYMIMCSIRRIESLRANHSLFLTIQNVRKSRRPAYSHTGNPGPRNLPRPVISGHKSLN